MNPTAAKNAGRIVVALLNSGFEVDGVYDHPSTGEAHVVIKSDRKQPGAEWLETLTYRSRSHVARTWLVDLAGELIIIADGGPGFPGRETPRGVVE
jgi:hypothetical protein